MFVLGITTTHVVPTTQRQKDVVHITTGCQAVNELLAGGIESKAITEIFGEWRCARW